MKNIVLLAFLSCASAFVYADFVNPEDVKKAWEVEQQKKKDDYIASLKGKELWLNKSCVNEYSDNFKMYAEVPTGDYFKDKKISYYVPSDQYEKILIEDVEYSPNGSSNYILYTLKLPNSKSAYIMIDDYYSSNKMKVEEPDRYESNYVCWTAINPLEYRKQQEILEAAEAKARASQPVKPGVSLGMTKKQVLTKTSWGKPDSVNRTTNMQNSVQN